jgi:two-component sensor histidine kinase
MSTEANQGVVGNIAKLMMHRLIVRQIRRDPTLVERGKIAHARQADRFAGGPFVRKWDELMIPADKAIPLGLLINELVTNAAKHAYPDGSGEIHVSGEQRGGDLHVEVSDQGIGLPKDFDIDQPRASLGFKVIKSLLGQLDGRITVSSNQPKGATIQLDLPLDLPS